MYKERIEKYLESSLGKTDGKYAFANLPGYFKELLSILDENNMTQEPSEGGTFKVKQVLVGGKGELVMEMEDGRWYDLRADYTGIGSAYEPVIANEIENPLHNPIDDDNSFNSRHRILEIHAKHEEWLKSLISKNMCEHLWDDEEYMPTCHRCGKLMRDDSPKPRTMNVSHQKIIEALNIVVEKLEKKASSDPEIAYCAGVLLGVGKMIEEGTVVKEEKIVVK